MTNAELAVELKIAASLIAETRPLSGVSLLVGRASEALAVGDAESVASANNLMGYVKSLLVGPCPSSAVEDCEDATRLAVDAFESVFGAV